MVLYIGYRVPVPTTTQQPRRPMAVREAQWATKTTPLRPTQEAKNIQGPRSGVCHHAATVIILPFFGAKRSDDITKGQTDTATLRRRTPATTPFHPHPDPVPMG